MNQNLLVKGFTKPKSIQYEKDELTPSYGRFVIYPFERGFGHTVGNVFRRVLLSSIPGYAITAIRVQSWNDKNELYVLPSPFENIPEVKEETLDIINSLKNVKLRLLDDIDSRTIKLDFKGASSFTAGKLKIDDSIEVMNPDLHIMTFTEKANVTIELQIDAGRGYIDIDRQEKYGEKDISTILIDSIFSPVDKVKYEVSDTRIGQRTDYDKLIFELWTDGTISPEDAMGIAAKILTDHFSVFINFKVPEVNEEKEEKDEDQELKQILMTPVEELELSVRAGNCLRSENVRTIGDLVCKTEEEVSKIQHFGKKSLTEIKEKLVKYKLSFGMKEIVAKVLSKK